MKDYADDFLNQEMTSYRYSLLLLLLVLGTTVFKKPNAPSFQIGSE